MRRSCHTRSVAAPKRTRQLERRQKLNVDFEATTVICREGRYGWRSDEAISTHHERNTLGFSSKVSTYRNRRLVGGMWGITVRGTFGIMSMFHHVDGAGSLEFIATVTLVRSMTVAP
jgi:leucyl/phenylalanyl-tRNA--protein transferase